MSTYDTNVIQLGNTNNKMATPAPVQLQLPLTVSGLVCCVFVYGRSKHQIMACTQHVRVTSLLTWTHRGCTPRDPTRTSVTFPISFHVESYTNEINNMLGMLNDGCSMIHNLHSYHFYTRVLYIHYCVRSMAHELGIFFSDSTNDLN